jgi:hypothetical protein
MRPDEARALLGVTGDDPGELRAAYRRRLRAVHPDLNPSPDASEATRQLTVAYRLLLESATTGPEPSGAPPRTDRRRPPVRPSEPRLRVAMLDASTVAVDAARDEVLDALVDVADALGELVYLDAHAGLLEVVVEFVDEPTSTVTMSLQGRADGTVEVFCSVEPLSGGSAPPLDAVTRLVATTLRATQDATGSA